MTLTYEAMMFARRVHATQVRKYTGNPYIDHLAEVAGIIYIPPGQGFRHVCPSCGEVTEVISQQPTFGVLK